ncbi:hypothetical protein BU23DRAFT_15946 [Bimuria novae-zelandiae CBS 107.79]|uniref:Transmembrane protein n=1 Tax=Bimuria novae-zelandiae CBS 107.79 TaxID=1447943 RepID=A0A6A5VPW2_9PLEO|nr:hypothetical protein BU23DRAFT_15946 [Bimuria novae-zelandiae CBS 107.79]
MRRKSCLLRDREAAEPSWSASFPGRFSRRSPRSRCKTVCVAVCRLLLFVPVALSLSFYTMAESVRRRRSPGRQYIRTISYPLSAGKISVESTSYVAVSEWPARAAVRLFCHHHCNSSCQQHSTSPEPALCCVVESSVVRRSGRIANAWALDDLQECAESGCGHCSRFEVILASLPPQGRHFRRLSLPANLTLVYDA